MADMSIFKKITIKSFLRNYNVLIIDDFIKYIEEDSRDNPFFIIDQKIFKLYKNELSKAIKNGQCVIVEAVESNKTLAHINILIGDLIKRDIKRNNKLIVIGGGIIQDIGSFIASILFRGMGWIFYPTTLLSQSDSCIGSKTSINIDNLKNQVGTFHPPIKVVLDTNFLRTLTSDDIKSGMGEIIKVHLLDNKKSMEYVSKNYEKAYFDCSVLKNLIIKSLIIKKRIIEKDEFDKNYRNLLNYGHTFGHALESATNYLINHGQAVTIGMDIANYVSFKKGLLSKRSFNNMRKILLKNYPDFNFKEEQKKDFFTALSHDKKNIGSELTAILTKGPGKMEKIIMEFDSNLIKIIDSFFQDFRN